MAISIRERSTNTKDMVEGSIYFRMEGTQVNLVAQIFMDKESSIIRKVKLFMTDFGEEENNGKNDQ